MSRSWTYRTSLSGRIDLLVKSSNPYKTFCFCLPYLLSVMAITWNVSSQETKPIRGSGFIKKKSNKREHTSPCSILWCAQTKPFKLGHFYDDDIWLQPPEFISVLLSYLHLHVNLPIPWDLKNNSPN